MRRNQFTGAAVLLTTMLRDDLATLGCGLPGLSPGLPRERHVGGTLRNARIVVPVAIPRPANARVQHLAIAPHLLKARTIDAPHIAILRRQRPSIRNIRQPAPRERQFHRPAAVGIGPAIDHAIHVDRGAQSRKVPVQEPPALAARVNVPTTPASTM